MFELEALLRPIREDAPAGDNLRADPSPTSPYYQIKDARNAARVAERTALQSDDPMSVPSGDWVAVLELAPKLLGQASKDIEVAAWMIEALLRREGFQGLRRGFELVRRLVEDFWDDLYPRPDEEGLETRVAPLTGLNGDDSEGTLIVPIGMVPLLVDGKGPLTTWHYRVAREGSAIVDPEARQRRLDAGAVPLERFSAAVAMSDPGELFATLDEVSACLAEWGQLTAALDARCGSDSPPSSNVRQALQDVLDCMEFLTKDVRRPSEADEAAATGQGSGGEAAPTAQQVSAPGVIATRNDAIDAMRRAGEFFRRTEPHSPVPYVVDQALRWAQMPLHVLVSELITDSNALAQFQMRTGIPASNDDSK